MSYFFKIAQKGNKNNLNTEILLDYVFYGDQKERSNPSFLSARMSCWEKKMRVHDVPVYCLSLKIYLDRSILSICCCIAWKQVLYPCIQL